MEAMAKPTMARRARGKVSFLFEVWTEYMRDSGPHWAAGLAYYTVFSIAPLLLISIGVAGFLFGEEHAKMRVMEEVQKLVGQPGTDAIRGLLEKTASHRRSVVSTLVGIFTLFWAASNVFSSLQNALNSIWKVRPDPRLGYWSLVRARAISATMVLIVGVLLLASIALSAALAAAGAYFGDYLPIPPVLLQISDLAFSTGMATVMFAMIFRVLPDVTIQWRDVWMGAFFTAATFSLGKMLIGLYLGNAAVVRTFGAAASLLVVLIWVYLSSQILFFGAEWTKVFARHYGSRIVPSPHAVPAEPPCDDLPVDPARPGLIARIHHRIRNRFRKGG